MFLQLVLKNIVLVNVALSVSITKSNAFSSGNAPTEVSSSIRSVLEENKNRVLSAAVARGVSISAVYPIDTYKTLIQMDPSGSFSSVIEANGFLAMYSGLFPSLLGQIPYGVLIFVGYEIYKKIFFQKFPRLLKYPLLVYVVCAVIGDLTGSVWICPSEVMKQQMQSGIWGVDATPLNVMKGILEKDGFLGLYRGYASNIVRDVPFRVLQLTTYDLLKSNYQSTNKTRNRGDKLTDDITSLEAAIFGALAGAIGAALTTPFDVVKTVLMTSRSAAGSESLNESIASLSWIECFNNVYDEYGLTGLFAGVVPRVELVGLMSSLFFVVNEFVFQQLEEEQRRSEKVTEEGRIS